MAEAVFKEVIARKGLASAMEVDSAAISRSHAKEKPDRRALACALSQGYSHIEKVRSRPVVPDDFVHHDLILAMDESVLKVLERQCPPLLQHKLDLFMRFARHPSILEVPDPYYGTPDGFTKVLSLCEEGVAGIIQRINEPPRPA